MDTDDRFKNIANDPKFRTIPKTERKVKIDKRFKSMFKDKQFKVKYTVDKRGRPVNHTSTEDLKRYYDLSTSDESESSGSESESDDNTEEPGKFVRLPKTLPDKIKSKLKDLSVDYARGEGKIASDSSSDDESESEESSDELSHNWGELDRDADTTNETTNRLAICNMDWDRIRATDLMVLFNSFLPADGIVESITIYPSEFGLKRMKEEEVHGPSELTENNIHEETAEENEDGAKYHMEKLRKYQLNRLRYYYGVVVCDTPQTANKIYTECDGLEYESSANKIDLRFIPEDTTFDEKPKEVCNRLPEKYEPRFFTTTALQQAKVNLTWDETDPERLEIAKKLSDGKIDDVGEEDLQAYLASSSDESENEDNDTLKVEENSSENPIDKYKSLLQEIEKTEEKKKNKGIEMEVTWGLDMKDKTEKLVKKKIAEAEKRTPFQEYLEKRKEKRKQKREERKKKHNENQSDEDIPSDIDMNDPYFAEEFDTPEFKSKKKVTKPQNNTETDPEKQAELELLLFDENEDNKKHFNMKKIQEQETTKKSRKNKETPKNIDDFEVNVKDDRFSALFTSHHYNIDPTDPHFRKTKAMSALIEEKLKRRADDDDNDENPVEIQSRKRSKVELSALVKSVKRKAQALNVKN